MAIKSMLNLKPFQIYFKVIYIFGLNPLISFDDINKKSSKIVFILPRIANIFLNVFVIWNFADFIPRRRMQEDSVYSDINIIWKMLINSVFFVSVIENSCNLSATRQILRVMSFVIANLEASLKIHFPYNDFKKSVEWGFHVQMITILMTTIIRFTINVLYKNTYELPTLAIVYGIFKCIILCHLIIYINFITFILAKLNQKIVALMIDKNINCCREENREWLLLMRQSKLIHFKLWKMSHYVNSLFGWFSVVFIVQSATSVIRDMFSGFEVAVDPDINQIFILRKYFE